MLDPFAIDAGIQDMTSWFPVSTDVWGACQFQVVTTCVTIGSVCLAVTVTMINTFTWQLPYAYHVFPARSTALIEAQAVMTMHFPVPFQPFTACSGCGPYGPYVSSNILLPPASSIDAQPLGFSQ
jgi:hypothetical protein